MEAYDEKKISYQIEGTGDFAMLLQHEIDHLNGILYFDHLENKEKDLIESILPIISRAYGIIFIG